MEYYKFFWDIIIFHTFEYIESKEKGGEKNVTLIFFFI